MEASGSVPVPPATAAAVDTDTIRETCGAVLWASTAVQGEERALLGELLRGHVQLLVPEVDAAAPGMEGEWQRTAVHVVTRTRQMLENGIGTSAMDVWNLATQCRALLTLYQLPGPLAGGYTTEARS
jgi:hypothetical protein